MALPEPSPEVRMTTDIATGLAELIEYLSCGDPAHIVNAIYRLRYALAGIDIETRAAAAMYVVEEAEAKEREAVDKEAAELLKEVFGETDA